MGHLLDLLGKTLWNLTLNWQGMFGTIFGVASFHCRKHFKSGVRISVWDTQNRCNSSFKQLFMMRWLLQTKYYFRTSHNLQVIHPIARVGVQQRPKHEPLGKLRFPFIWNFEMAFVIWKNYFGWQLWKFEMLSHQSNLVYWSCSYIKLPNIRTTPVLDILSSLSKLDTKCGDCWLC